MRRDLETKDLYPAKPIPVCGDMKIEIFTKQLTKVRRLFQSKQNFFTWRSTFGCNAYFSISRFFDLLLSYYVENLVYKTL